MSGNFERKFQVIPDESRIPHGKEDSVMNEARELGATLDKLFPRPCQYGVCQPGQYSGKEIVNRLVDTNDTRNGPPPTEVAMEKLIRESDKCVGENCPLLLVGIYGTPRNLDRPDLNRAQLADLSAVMMIQAALDRVHSAHMPGAEYRAVDEDLCALWLDVAQHPKGEKGRDKFKATYALYLQDRLRLLSVLRKKGLIDVGNTKIELLSESELYGSAIRKKKSLGIKPEEEFFKECGEVRPKILDYLITSGDIMRQVYGADDHQWIGSEENPDLWEKCQKMIMATHEYSVLKETGWQGLIPPEMRKCYLEKFRTILGGANLEDNDPTLLFHIATYLSSTLVKYKAGTLLEGIPPGTPVIKVPLVKPVEGRPSTHQALIPQRTLPGGIKKVSNNNRAAWQSVAVRGGGKLRLMDTKEFASLPEELIVPVQIYVVGEGEESYLVDSAIILEKE